MASIGTKLSFSLEEEKSFDTSYHRIVDSLVKLNDNSLVGMEVVTRWMKNIINCNVTEKNSERLFVAAVCKTLEKEPSGEKMEQAFVLDWCLNYFHGFNLIANNLMDGKTECSISGNPTWHSLPNVGMMAVNDALLLRTLTYNMLNTFFSGQYIFYDEIRGAFDNHILGRGLFEKMQKNENVKEAFTLEKYRQVVHLVFSHNKFYLPVIFALLLAGKSECVDEKYLKNLLMDIGYYYKLKSDYAKTFSQNNEKNGMTESEFKLNWFFVKKVEKLNDNDLNNLLECIKERNYSEIQVYFNDKNILKNFVEEKKNVVDNISRKISEFEKVSNNGSLTGFLRLLVSEMK